MEYLPTYRQDPKKIYPNLMSELTAIFLQGSQMAQPDVYLTELIYYEHYIPILQLKFANLHLSHRSSMCIHSQTQALLRTILTTHLQWLVSTLTAQHYASLAGYFLRWLNYYSW